MGVIVVEMRDVAIFEDFSLRMIKIVEVFPFSF